MFCAIFNPETKEAEFIEQWDAEHTEGIQEDWEGTIEEFFEDRCHRIETVCFCRGANHWHLYKSETIPFSWDVIFPPETETKTSTVTKK